MNNTKQIATLILVIGFIVSLASCGNNHEQKKEDEIAKISSYLMEAGIGDSLLSDSGQMYAVESPSGFYYIERKLGDGDFITSGDEVSFRYESFYLDDSVTVQFGNLDYAHADVLTLGNTSASGSVPHPFVGFHQALAYMKNGGKATFILPSSLMYGTGGALGFPKYTSLRFEVSVTDLVKSN